MFVRVKGKEPNRYLQIVENRREGKRTLQRVVATLGRVDELAGVAGICSPICPWPFLTPPACILRGRAGKAWGSSATPRTTGPTAGR